jgi:hypothetical protein
MMFKNGAVHSTQVGAVGKAQLLVRRQGGR